MSQENVEIVRASYEVWNAGDMDAYRDPYDPDAVVRPPDGWPEPVPYFGREASMRWLQARKHGLAGECRRRDSNPRHADYDSAALTS
jgi:ketosteroid isomerase-like protein